MTANLIAHVEALKGADNLTRLSFLDEKHILFHPRLLAVEAKLRDIVESPVPYEKSRAFFSRSFNGKSTVTKHFASLYPPELNALGDAATIKVVRIVMPGEASVLQFAVRILEAVGEPFNRKWATSQLMSCAYSVLKSLSVKLLIIDEFQDIENGIGRNRLALTNVIKSIGEDCGCGVALFGMPEGVEIIASNPQLARRFEHETLDPWNVDTESAELLHNLEALLPLRKPSNIAQDPKLIEMIVTLGDGVFGHIHRVLIAAARTAISTGREVIDAKTIKQCGWVPLSARAGLTKLRLNLPEGEQPRGDA